MKWQSNWGTLEHHQVANRQGYRVCCLPVSLGTGIFQCLDQNPSDTIGTDYDGICCNQIIQVSPIGLDPQSCSLSACCCRTEKLHAARSSPLLRLLSLFVCKQFKPWRLTLPALPHCESKIGFTPLKMVIFHSKWWGPLFWWDCEIGRSIIDVNHVLRRSHQVTITELRMMAPQPNIILYSNYIKLYMNIIKNN